MSKRQMTKHSSPIGGGGLLSMDKKLLRTTMLMTAMLAAVTMLAVPTATTVQANEAVYCKEHLTIAQLLETDDNGNYVNHAYNVIVVDYAFGSGVTGSPGDDLIILNVATFTDGNGGNDCIIGHEGIDVITTGNGNDWIYGNGGNDHISTSDGSNYIVGGDGSDTISGGAGNNTIHQDSEPTYCMDDLTIPQLLAFGKYNVMDKRHTDSTVIKGTSADDLILTSDNGVIVRGIGGNDCIIGGAGDDRINGGDGDDSIYGEKGDDWLYGNNGSDTIHGGDGMDNLFGEAGDDILYGNMGNDRIYGGEDNDTLYGGEGNDEMWGMNGSDTVYGQAGNDIIFPGNDDDPDHLYGGLGTDAIHAGENDTAHQDDEPRTTGTTNTSEPKTEQRTTSEVDEPVNDKIVIGDRLEYAITRAADRQDCNEVIDGYHPTLEESANSDRWNVIDKRDSSDKVIIGTNGNDLILAPDHGVEIMGKKGNDCIIGGAGNDIIKGNLGDDVIQGNEGDDTINGGNGNDHLRGSTGDDTIKGGDGDDFIVSGSGSDTVYGNKGDDSIRGDTLDATYADTLRGNLGDDYVDGDELDTLVSGGRGNDTCTDVPNVKSCETLEDP